MIHKKYQELFKRENINLQSIREVFNLEHVKLDKEPTILKVEKVPLTVKKIRELTNNTANNIIILLISKDCYNPKKLCFLDKDSDNFRLKSLTGYAYNAWRTLNLEFYTKSELINVKKDLLYYYIIIPQTFSHTPVTLFKQKYWRLADKDDKQEVQSIKKNLEKEHAERVVHSLYDRARSLKIKNAKEFINSKEFKEQLKCFLNVKKEDLKKYLNNFNEKVFAAIDNSNAYQFYHDSNNSEIIRSTLREVYQLERYLKGIDDRSFVGILDMLKADRKNIRYDFSNIGCGTVENYKKAIEEVFSKMI